MSGDPSWRLGEEATPGHGRRARRRTPSRVLPGGRAGCGAYMPFDAWAASAVPQQVEGEVSAAAQRDVSARAQPCRGWRCNDLSLCFAGPVRRRCPDASRHRSPTAARGTPARRPPAMLTQDTPMLRHRPVGRRRTARVVALGGCALVIVALIGVVVRQSLSTSADARSLVHAEQSGAELLHPMTSVLGELV